MMRSPQAGPPLCPRHWTNSKNCSRRRSLGTALGPLGETQMIAIILGLAVIIGGVFITLRVQPDNDTVQRMGTIAAPFAPAGAFHRIHQPFIGAKRRVKPSISCVTPSGEPA